MSDFFPNANELDDSAKTNTESETEVIKLDIPIILYATIDGWLIREDVELIKTLSEFLSIVLSSVVPTLNMPSITLRPGMNSFPV